ncbi:hypothetical protein L9F63_017460, partial [Diploptera punctata]
YNSNPFFSLSFYMIGNLFSLMSYTYTSCKPLVRSTIYCAKIIIIIMPMPSHL